MVTQSIRRAAQRRVMAVYWQHLETRGQTQTQTQPEKEAKPARQVRIREERKGLFALVGDK